FWESITRFDARVRSLLLGAFGGGFGWGKSVFRVYYTNKNLSRPVRSLWGAEWGGCEQLHLDVVSFFGRINQLVPRRKGEFNRFVLTQFLLDFYVLNCSVKL